MTARGAAGTIALRPLPIAGRVGFQEIGGGFAASGKSLACLGVQHLQCFLFVLQVLRRSQEARLSWPRQRDRHRLLDVSRLIAHDQELVGQQDRLAYFRGDEQHRLSAVLDIEDGRNLAALGDFCRELGRETRQGEVGLVVGDVSFAIRDFTEGATT